MQRQLSPAADMSSHTRWAAKWHERTCRCTGLLDVSRRSGESIFLKVCIPIGYDLGFDTAVERPTIVSRRRQPTATLQDRPSVTLRPSTQTESAEAERSYAVFANLKIGGALVALVCIAVAPSASAVTAAVAKKCSALTAKAFPPRVVGNPAAGSAKGSGQDERDYFNKCVANGGNMDDQSRKGAK